MKNDHIPAPVLAALNHVRESIPEIDRVTVWKDGRWQFSTPDHDVPAFPGTIDPSILEEAFDRLDNYPAAFQLDDEP